MERRERERERERVRVRVIIGGVVTERDRRAIEWLVRNSVTSIALMAQFIFSGSVAMAGRRLRVLCGLGLVRQVPVGRRMSVFIATSRGADMTGLGLSPPRMSGLIGEIDHALLCCRVLYTLAERLSAEVITERELRTEIARKRRAGELVSGRVPDGLLVTVAPGGQRVVVAVEVDRTAKRSVQIRGLVSALLPRLGKSGEWRRVLWIAPTPAAAVRYKKVVDGLSAGDVVTVSSLGGVLKP